MTIAEEILQGVFDQTLRDITESMAGIRLYQVNAPPEGSTCTVYMPFEKGLRFVLAFQANTPMFVRLTRHILRGDEVTFQDLEDFTKEYYNVLCGHIIARLFQETRVALRFGIPDFCIGEYRPEGYQEQFAICYSSDRGEAARLIHYTPQGDFTERGDTYGKTNHGS